jgi:hypothetical protein
MLAAFMSFPVILGTKVFVAALECAPIRLLMTLLMLPIIELSAVLLADHGDQHLLELALTRKFLVTFTA